MGHKVDLRISREGGRNPSDWMERDIGETGQYPFQHGDWRRLGIGRTAVIELRDTSPYRSDVIGASIDLEPL